MKTLFVVLGLSVFLLVGCAGMSDIPNIPSIEKPETKACKYLGMVQGSGVHGFNKGRDKINTYNQMRTAAAEMGANAIYVEWDAPGGAQGRAYVCGK